MSRTVNVATPSGRTAGRDCLRIAMTIAYGGLYGISYADTPADDFPDGETQYRAWANWAAIRGLRMWRSYELAPVASPWLAIVDSPIGYSDHVVIMDGHRLHADPANHYTPRQIGPRQIRGAMMLLPANIGANHMTTFWSLPKPYRAVRRAGQQTA